MSGPVAIESLGGSAVAISLVASVVAGLVYGFAGFGAALVAVPVLSTVYSPADAVGIFSLSAIASLVTVVPRAWREADRRATSQLLASAALTLPLGLLVLRSTPSEALRWAICTVVLATLVALVGGWRREASDRTSSRLAVGAATGVVGGATGLTGPVVVLFALSGPDDAQRVRANVTLFLSLLSVLVLPMLVVGGVLGGPQAVVGLVLLPAYAVATVVGQALFRPGSERAYRVVAYTVVAVAGVAGLPLWDLLG